MYKKGFLIIFLQKEENQKILIDLFKGVLGNAITINSNSRSISILYDNSIDFNYDELINMINFDMFIPSRMFICKRLYSEKYYLEYQEYVFGLYDEFVKLKELVITEERLVMLNKISNVIFNNILGPYNNDLDMQKLLLAFFDSNMNISKTASLVYMHRNTVMNKIDRFISTTGLDIKKFKSAFMLYHLLCANLNTY